MLFYCKKIYIKRLDKVHIVNSNKYRKEVRYEKEKMKIKKLTIKLYFIIFTFEVTIERA